jgi:hypothetical protein
MGCNRDPPGINGYTQRRWLRVVLDPNLAPEVQKRQFSVQGPCTAGSTAFDLGSAVRDIAPKVSSCQCPGNREALPSNRSNGQRNPTERVENEEILVVLGNSFTGLSSNHCSRRAIERDVKDSTRAQANYFHGIPTGKESWFQSLYSFSEMFAHSRSDVVSRMRHAIGTEKL